VQRTMGLRRSAAGACRLACEGTPFPAAGVANGVAGEATPRPPQKQGFWVRRGPELQTQGWGRWVRPKDGGWLGGGEAGGEHHATKLELR
jgi:hypothetical protein